MKVRRRKMAARALGAALLLAIVAAGVVLRQPLASLGQQRPLTAAQKQAQREAQREAMQARLVRQRVRSGLGLLKARLGRDRPVGRGITFAHVEGMPGKYTPNLGARRFDKIDTRAMSGRSEVFGHTVGTSRVIYGPQGMAPGVPAVDFYAMPDWLGKGFLRAGTPFGPVATDARVMTHSWIGNTGPLVEEILARVDYVIDTRDVVMTVGVNNGKDTPIPALLASAYNVIAVGAWDGDSSTGPTLFAGVGRCKPDIVAPGRQTSFSTPAVAAAAGLLLETADGLAATDPEARRAETIKALLLTGAAKPADWSHTATQPLDARYGAGRLRVDLAHAIFEAGRARVTVDAEAESHDVVAALSVGWDLQAVDRGETLAYDLHVVEDGTPLSVTAVWHRQVAGNLSREPGTGRPRWNAYARLADFDLQLQRREADGSWTVVAESVSRVDNVEHVFLPAAQVGRYRLHVPRLDRHAGAWDVAVAWRSGAIAPMSTRVAPDQAASQMDGAVDDGAEEELDDEADSPEDDADLDDDTDGDADGESAGE